MLGVKGGVKQEGEQVTVLRVDGGWGRVANRGGEQVVKHVAGKYLPVVMNEVFIII